MTATRNWSHNSFERVVELFVPLIMADWMTHLNIVPIEYSNWSDTLYVEVHFSVTDDARQKISEFNTAEKEHLRYRMATYIANYFDSFLNTKVLVKEFKSKN
jgi:hypothetical protein